MSSEEPPRVVEAIVSTTPKDDDEGLQRPSPTLDFGDGLSVDAVGGERDVELESLASPTPHRHGHHHHRDSMDESHEFESTEDLPPLRIHATRVPERLSASNLVIPEGLEKKLPHFRRHSRDSGSRSRSRSPSVGKGTPPSGGSISGLMGNNTTTTNYAPTETTQDAGSSVSSLQDLEDFVVDPDILLDKAGMEELDPLASQRSVKDLAVGGGSSLQAVNERLSDETLEDAHAFQDLNPKASVSRDNSIGAGMDVLQEGDEDNEDDDMSPLHTKPEVILENMEHLEINESHVESGGVEDSTTGAADDSIPTDTPVL
jgi:hypothetical protein|mmetsp:Transcript_9585/g.12473  ORF Transcript_9585/g.12473 Transcript_9585/m.12473 type:complete len:316 (-) Transcript_9585:315-1262(-)